MVSTTTRGQETSVSITRGRQQQKLVVGCNQSLKCPQGESSVTQGCQCELGSGPLSNDFEANWLEENLQCRFDVLDFSNLDLGRAVAIEVAYPNGSRAAGSKFKVLRPILWWQ